MVAGAGHVRPQDAVPNARPRHRRRVGLAVLVVAMLATPSPAVAAQDREPSGSELRQTYPLGQSNPTAAQGGDSRAAPPATHPADSGGSVKPAIAAGLALLAFAAGFSFGFRPVRRRLPGALRVSAGGHQ